MTKNYLAKEIRKTTNDDDANKNAITSCIIIDPKDELNNKHKSVFLQ